VALTTQMPQALHGRAPALAVSGLDDFARGLAALALDLGDRMADTVIVTRSEFGRAVAQNGSGGTDHGHGNAVFVLGGAVKGGHVYGRWPGLAPGGVRWRAVSAVCAGRARCWREP